MKKLTTTATMLSIAMTTGAMAEPEKFNMATPWPGGQIMKSANRFADRVKLFTNGEVEIEVHVGGQLGGALKVTDTVRNGVWAGLRQPGRQQPRDRLLFDHRLRADRSLPGTGRV